MTQQSTYDEISQEYYNPVLHPTCANFAQLSELYLAPLIKEHARENTSVLEIGAGRSIVARIMASMRLPLGYLTLLDASQGMLSYSTIWLNQGARAVIADAWATGLAAGAYHLIVSSLGDPYNGPPFWKEVHRLLSPDGLCLFTTPSSEWADRFRVGTDRSSAEFLLQGGKTVFVRSEVPKASEQIRMCEDAGLQVVQGAEFTLQSITGHHSYKLVFDKETDIPLVRGYLVKKCSTDAKLSRDFSPPGKP